MLKYIIKKLSEQTKVKLVDILLKDLNVYTVASTHDRKERANYLTLYGPGAYTAIGKVLVRPFEEYI